ncbi:ras-related protein rab-24 [Anaeramoeba flamelloides]|uniref:Ras-related protein rab-24 n=1 Tax=Anaeramoeba flamelloides TaxID=1746091 RepID=A0AAV8A004_9EUKA|nr:ras-related protein rab-24 [Anaeramoeba flamelloides]KAJ6229080.1 ras-related protein rab-24 [Anaeramoeba flamelloides]
MSETDIDLKVLLLGNAYVGKSSIFERFVNENYTNSIEATIGVAFAIKGIEIEEKQIYLGIWDTAGEEKFESVAVSYYRNAKAAILCYDVNDRRTFDKIKYWVSELKKISPDCKIYLTGTKIDLIKDKTERKVPVDLVQKFSKSLGIKSFETSAKTGIGIAELFEQIGKDYIMDYKKEDEDLDSNEVDLNDFQMENTKKGCC